MNGSGKSSTDVARPDGDAQIAGLVFALLLVDEKAEIKEANHAAESLLGISARRLVGTSLLEILAPFETRLEERLTDADAALVARDISVRNGELRVNLTVSPLGSHPGWRVVTLAQAVQDDAAYNDKAESAVSAPAVLAHEIKNPLAAIRGAGQLAARKLPDGDKKLAHMITDEVDRIARLIDRMQELGAQSTAEAEPCNPHEAIRAAIATVRAGSNSPVEIREAFDPSLPPALANRDALEQVLINLISNARDAALGNQNDPPAPSSLGEATAASTGDMYIAAISPSGVLVVFVEPVSGPSIAPDVDQARALAEPLQSDGSVVLEPSTVQWAVGGSDVRAVVADVGLGRTLIVARSTGPIDDAQNQILVASGLAVLAIAAVLGVAMWWVDRLGLQPISRLTVAAEEVAAGRSERRVVVSTSDNETGRLGAAFNAMLDARQESEDRQRQFVADASHELRTPLTALRGYADLYFADGLSTPAAIGDAMRRIQVEGARMAALTEDLLTLASLDEGRPLDLVDVDVSQLVIDIAADAAAIQPDRRVDSEGVSDGLVVHADRDLLTQAITAATSPSRSSTKSTICAQAKPQTSGPA